jgi:hypothetical protein
MPGYFGKFLSADLQNAWQRRAWSVRFAVGLLWGENLQITAAQVLK